MNLKDLILSYDKTYLKFFVKSLFGQSRPFYSLIFQVTNLCNSRCVTCFNWKILNQDSGREMTLEEIEKFTQKIGDLNTLTVGGGEPFLRKDLPEIIECFGRNNNLKVVAIPTNCLLTEKIVSQTEKILKNFNGGVKIGLSLDGLAADHDKIRGVQGNFEKFLATYRALCDLRKKYPKLRLRVCTTVFDANIDKIIELIKFVDSSLPEVDILGLEFLRGDYNVQKVGSASPDKVLKVIEFLEERRRQEKNIYRRVISNFYYRLSLDILNKRTQVIPCRISAFYPVIDALGNVYPCENLPKIGNLRENDFDLNKIWRSGAAQKMRESIRRKECYCTHSCYQIPNMYLSPKMIFKILRGKY